MYTAVSTAVDTVLSQVSTLITGASIVVDGGQSSVSMLQSVIVHFQYLHASKIYVHNMKQPSFMIAQSKEQSIEILEIEGALRWVTQAFAESWGRI